MTAVSGKRSWTNLDTSSHTQGPIPEGKKVNSITAVAPEKKTGFGCPLCYRVIRGSGTRHFFCERGGISSKNHDWTVFEEQVVAQKTAWILYRMKNEIPVSFV